MSDEAAEQRDEPDKVRAGPKPRPLQVISVFAGRGRSGVRGDGHTRLGVLAAVFLSFALGAVNVRAVESGHIGPLSFDPHGADFTAWINHFKTQVYKHWPPEEQIGSYGHVVMEFTVARDGALQRVRVKKATG